MKTNPSTTVHRVAVYAAWMSSACAMTMAGLVWVFNTDWFVLRSTDTPIDLDAFAPQVILVLGFVIVVAAMCGGFRRTP